MGQWDPKYTPEQREALAHAYEDRRIRPAQLVADLANRNELQEGLEPFTHTVGPNTVRDFAKKLRRRRAGELKSDLASQPPRDAIENLRQRLVNCADKEMGYLERVQQNTSKRADRTRNVALIGALARVVRELAALPGPGDPRAVKPGHKIPGTQTEAPGNRNGSGLAGQIMKAHKAGSGTVQGSPPSLPGSQGQETGSDGVERSAAHDTTHKEEQRLPGRSSHEQEDAPSLPADT